MNKLLGPSKLMHIPLVRISIWPSIDVAINPTLCFTLRMSHWMQLTLSLTQATCQHHLPAMLPICFIVWKDISMRNLDTDFTYSSARWAC